MKKLKSAILPAFLILLTTVCVVLSVALCQQTEQMEPAEAPKGNTIKVPEEEVGRVTIYQDGVVAYEYEGPLLYIRKDGEFRIEVWTAGSCSCFEKERIKE